MLLLQHVMGKHDFWDANDNAERFSTDSVLAHIVQVQLGFNGPKMNI